MTERRFPRRRFHVPAAAQRASARRSARELAASLDESSRSRTENDELSSTGPSSAFTGGFDCEFVDSVPESLTCPVCLLPFRDPHMLDCCGAKYCAVCIDKVKASRKLACPICRQPTFKAMLDKTKQRKILSLKVYCARKSKGCEWVGELRSFDDHVTDSCGWVEVLCRYCDQRVFLCRQTSHEQNECPVKKMDSIKRTVELCLVSEMGTLRQELKRDMDELRRDTNKKFKDQKCDILELGREMDTKSYVADHERKELRRKIDKRDHADIRLELDKARAEIKELRRKVDNADVRLELDKARAEIKELRHKVDGTDVQPEFDKACAEIKELRCKMDNADVRLELDKACADIRELQEKMDKTSKADLQLELYNARCDIRQLQRKMGSADLQLELNNTRAEMRRQLDILESRRVADKIDANRNLTDLRREMYFGDTNSSEPRCTCVKIFVLVAVLVIILVVATRYLTSA